MVFFGVWCINTSTQLQILDLPVLELDPLNINLFLDFQPAKRVLSTRSSKSSRICSIKNVFPPQKKGHESVNFRLRRARPEIRRPWTCSRSHTYMQDSDPQIYLLWSSYYCSSML
jgi:hypothetical protein